jgi:hypothetical protein
VAIRPGISKFDWEIELTDTKSKKKYGLKVPQGSLQIGTISQDDTIFIRNVGKRVGDFDEQRSWKAGRGIENLSDNAEAYWDSKDAWTLTPGHVHQTLQWYHARGLRNEDMYMPTFSAGDVEFVPLLGDQRFIANSFSASASYSAKQGYIWVRRRGSPGDLVFQLMTNSGGNPDTALKSVTKTISDITDFISVCQLFQWPAATALTGATTYWVSIRGATTDDRDNCWEVGVNPDASSGKISSNGISWSAASFALYYRVTDTDVLRRWFRFNLKDAFYLIDSKDDDTTASKMYINGDRGMATAGSASTLTDSAKSWTTNRWAGTYVRIIDGTGRFNTPMQILSNTATALTIDGTWDSANPSTTSQYVIYATEWFTEITLSGASLSVVTGEPAVVNNVAYIPQGNTVFLHVQWNTTTFAHDAFAETATGSPPAGKGKADFFLATNDNADGPVLWRANNVAGTGTGGKVTVSRANLLSSGSFIAWNTALTWKTGIFTGSTSYLITSLAKKGEEIYVFREDGLGTVVNDRYKNIDTGIDKTPSRANGAMAIAHGQFLYYSWLHSVVRVYGASHDDVGDDYRGIGLPTGREGEYADADSYLKLLFFAINAGSTGTSSVLCWDGLGWHEVLRNKRSGQKTRMVKVQVCPGTRNRLWTDFGGGDLVFQELPLFRSSPRLASGSRYMHEGVIESATIDMGTASGLAKFIKELTVTVSNLNGPGREIFVDIQADDDVHTTTWTVVDIMRKSPESIVFLGLQNVRRFAYRLRMCSNRNDIPIDVEGVVPNGYARTPFKMTFSMQIQAGGIFSRRGKLATSDELMRWLLDSARQPGRVRMDSVYEMAHGWYVIIHPPNQFPMVPRKGRNPETANFSLVLQEV